MQNAEYFFGCQINMALAVKMCQMCQLWIEQIMIDHEQTVFNKRHLNYIFVRWVLFLKE